MVTARQEPRLVLITTGCENGYLTLSAQGMKKLCLPVKLPSKNPVQNCRVFGLDIQGRDCGDEVAQWITTFLNSEPYRLVHFEPSMVPRKSKDIINLFRTTDEVAYPDCSPLLIISEASLKDLNTRLEKKVKIQNFRPNIFVSDCGAFEEDNWEDILIGDVEMKGTVCCGRCILTTVDPDTGVLDRKEPLETLKSYRLCDPSERHIYKSSPLFGKYFAVDKTGTIQEEKKPSRGIAPLCMGRREILDICYSKQQRCFKKGLPQCPFLVSSRNLNRLILILRSFRNSLHWAGAELRTTVSTDIVSFRPKILKCLPVLSKTTTNNENFQSFHQESKKPTGKKSSPPKRFQASKTFVSVFSSARGDAGSFHLLSRMPMLSHQGGSVVEEQFFDLFIMKKIPMPQLQVIEKLYY